MERKQHSDEGEEERMQISNITINGDYDDNHDDDDEELKRKIACHSLYGLLVESHFDCFKLCLGNMENIENVINPTAFPNRYPNSFKDDQLELDQFMEAYCMTLNKLKEVMDEAQQESMAFIKLMYSQLEELLLEIPTSPTLSPISKK